MRKFFIVLITGVGIILAIALYFIVDNFNINAMDTTERMTFFLQVLAGFVTACISIWGLTIAHRKNKHWEIEKCDEFENEYDTLSREWILNITNYDKKAVRSLTIKIFNFYERLALLEKRSYIDSDILYDRFYPSLFHDLEHEICDEFLTECSDDKYTYYHTRTLYIKWKERYKNEEDNKDHEKSWTEMQKLIKKAKKK